MSINLLRLGMKLAAVCVCGMVFCVGAASVNAQVGGVYVQTNDTERNEIAAFGRASDGRLYFIGNYATGGTGSTEFDGGEGLDPLISADSIITTEDQRFLITVNAGSDSITSFQILSNFRLRRISTVSSGGVGPNSLAIRNNLVFVSNIDRDGFALGDPETPRGEPNDEGNITAFRINRYGVLRPIAGSTIELDNRPADLGISADGSKLIVTSITAGSVVLPGENSENSVAVYDINPDGSNNGLVGAATSTEVGNEEGRNLPSAIDFDTTVINGREFVVVTEAREFNSVGLPPTLPALQSGSVSVYELTQDGELDITASDIALGDPDLGAFDPSVELTACWIDFARDGRTFFVSNAISASISSFRLNDDGTTDLLEQEAAQGTSGFANGDTTGPEVFGTTDGFIDLDVTDDGRFLYQLAGLDGSIYVYRVDGRGGLTFVQEASGDLPEIDTQGLVTVSSQRAIQAIRFIDLLKSIFGRFKAFFIIKFYFPYFLGYF